MSNDASLLIIACGALAHEITALIEVNRWQHVSIQCLPAELHNRPEEIPGAVKAKLNATGKQFDQADAIRMGNDNHDYVFICGRYEGIDERLIEREVDEEWSVGDFVLSGGELPAMTLMDAVIRLVPGVLGHELSAQQDSFMDGLLDCPHYTRPEVYEGQTVPEVLLSGNHEKIRQWRLKQALGRTWQRRPDLLAELELTNEQQKLLTEYLNEHAESPSDC